MIEAKSDIGVAVKYCVTVSPYKNACGFSPAIPIYMFYLGMAAI